MGKTSYESKSISRINFKRVNDHLPNGKEVGAYSPKFDVIEKR